MPTRNDKPEQIVAVLRQIEVQMGNGNPGNRGDFGRADSDQLELPLPCPSEKWKGKISAQKS